MPPTSVIYAGRQQRPQLQRCLSTFSQSEKNNIISWINAHSLPVKQQPSHDHISPSRLDALRCTLPTLDGSLPIPSHRRPEHLTKSGAPLSPGHSLIFCNPPAPERCLNADATTSLLRPPAPLARRMWAGGRFEFRRPIRVGDDIVAEMYISKIEVKRLDSENPMMIVEKTIEMRVAEDVAKADVSDTGYVTEIRSHVYLPVSASSERRVQIVKDLPKADFSLSYTPTDTMLFRFSALTFNAHRIHLYKDYAQQVEKLPERLVHGPMTALMLLETMENNRPGHTVIRAFQYRATNPLFINRRITVHGAWSSESTVKLWAQADGVVGMVGEIQLSH